MNTERVIQKLRVFSGMTRELASLSTCERDRVSCMVIPRDFSRVLAIGYNGPAAGLPNDSCAGKDAVGTCGCVHSETSALVKLTENSLQDLRMLCSRTPCERCAGVILNSRKITWLIHDTDYREDGGSLMLRRAGVIVSKLDDLVSNQDLLQRW